MKVFSKEKYIKEIEGKIKKEKNKEFKEILKGMLEMSIGEDNWATICDGKKVVDGKIKSYKIADEWCIEVKKEKNTPNKKYSIEEIREMVEEAIKEVEKAKKSTSMFAKFLADEDDKVIEIWESIAEAVLKGIEIKFYDILEGEEDESK